MYTSLTAVSKVFNLLCKIVKIKSLNKKKSVELPVIQCELLAAHALQQWILEWPIIHFGYFLNRSN